ncbi:FkbM family methyltransferase [Patescibacteria group bacterium]|nr:FkbM family methyltransferase [Patescibacteria group bacterium]
MLDSIVRKLKTAVALIANSPDWPKYYLDYLGIFKRNWVLRFGKIKIEIRPNSVDKWVVVENLGLKVYRLDNVKHAKFDQIFDIGANIGTFTIAAAQVFHKAQIIAFEPDTENLKLLKTNLKLNKLTKRVKLYECAVSTEKAKTIQLYKGNDFAANSTQVKSQMVTNVSNVHFGDLQKMIKGKAFLKVDIEGGEIDLFTQDYVKLLKSFAYIIVEYHHFLPTHKREPFEKFLTKNNFKYTRDDLIYFLTL